jgi:hypothetical protein
MEEWQVDRALSHGRDIASMVVRSASGRRPSWLQVHQTEAEINRCAPGGLELGGTRTGVTRFGREQVHVDVAGEWNVMNTGPARNPGSMNRASTAPTRGDPHDLAVDHSNGGRVRTCRSFTPTERRGDGSGLHAGVVRVEPATCREEWVLSVIGSTGGSWCTTLNGAAARSADRRPTVDRGVRRLEALMS